MASNPQGSGAGTAARDDPFVSPGPVSRRSGEPYPAPSGLHRSERSIVSTNRSRDRKARPRILVLDADMVPSLTIARSLKRRGADVDIAGHEPASLSALSNCVASVLIYPNPLTEPAAFVDWVEERLARASYALVIPVTERTLVPLHLERQRLDQQRIAMAPARALEIALDKARTVALAHELGIRVPHGCSPHSTSEALAFAADHGYPVVVKPAASIGADSIQRVHLSVSYASDEHQLRAQVTHALRHGSVLVQELFRGRGVGIELIADRGEVRFSFEHQRLHEVPLTGGGSSLRLSVPVRPELLEASRKLMAALNWHGVAMVEFKEDPETGEFCLMEINGRFWGSLPLAVAAGADFPAMLLELLAEGEIQTRPPARTGIYCRNLQKDMHWMESVLRRNAPIGLVSLPSRYQMIKDLLLVVSPRHRFDVQQWRDPRPGIEDMRRSIVHYSERIAHLLSERRLLRRQRAAWQKGLLARRLHEGSRLLFLCYGNINRSAVAEMLARERLPARFTLESAGFHPQAGRPADPVMVEVAARHGHDLSGSRSRQLSAEMVDRAHLILAMEPAHLRRAAELFPDSASKAYLLGPAAPAAVSDGAIADPYGKPPQAYEQCFSQLDQCITVLARLAGCGQDLAPAEASVERSRAPGEGWRDAGQP